MKFLIALAILFQLSFADSPILLDVRSKKEFESGHRPGAINIPLDELADRTGELRKESHIVVYCEVGMRSRAAIRILEKAGFQKVENGGGFEG